MRRKVSDGLVHCPYFGKCIHRTEDGGCIALIDTDFGGDECHFRKEKYDGKFVVDEKQKQRKGK